MKFNTISLTFAAALAFGLARRGTGATREVNLLGEIRDILKARA